MGRYTGPKARVNRRFGAMLYENAGATRAADRRSAPPGMHTRGGRRPSNYGAGLAEKQKVKHYYGLGERQLRRYFDSVVHKPGNTGQVLLLTCERRLDNVVRRVGFAVVAIPLALAVVWTVSRSAISFTASSWEAASSSRSSAGRRSSARAIAMRWRWPPPRPGAPGARGGWRPGRGRWAA
jgi:small subunit ribosomal protein S4